MMRTAALVPTLIAAQPGAVAPEPRFDAAPSKIAGNHWASRRAGHSSARAGRSCNGWSPICGKTRSPTPAILRSSAS
jgi:hypothetical protein